MNGGARLEFEIASYDVAVQHFSHNTPELHTHTHTHTHTHIYIYIYVEMNTATRVQIPDEAV